ncbi:MAG TPA: oxidoreductase [Rhodocyclaceae bacterium]|nr:oxidoreductase [Rhodocyclaceae bacterium]
MNKCSNHEVPHGDFNLCDSVVVITGGAGLLGKEFARAVVLNGGRPVVADIRIDAAETAARLLNEELGTDRVSAVEMDITSKESLQNAISFLRSSFGCIDALVNNAYPRNKNYGRRFETVEFSDFCENVGLHLGGYFLASQQFALFFKEQGYGNIVTVSSIYGVMAPRFDIYENTSMTMPVEYAAIKSALIHLNGYMLKYFQGNGIRFNCLSPGGILDAQPEAFLKKYAAYAQSKGMLSPSDITGALVFLLSNQSRYINGQNIVVDDGWSI